MQLGELIEKMTTSDRLVIINAAGQVIYRGYAANLNVIGCARCWTTKKARCLSLENVWG